MLPLILYLRKGKKSHHSPSLPDTKGYRPPIQKAFKPYFIVQLRSVKLTSEGCTDQEAGAPLGGKQEWEPEDKADPEKQDLLEAATKETEVTGSNEDFNLHDNVKVKGNDLVDPEDELYHKQESFGNDCSITDNEDVTGSSNRKGSPSKCSGSWSVESTEDCNVDSATNSKDICPGDLVDDMNGQNSAVLPSQDAEGDCNSQVCEKYALTRTVREGNNTQSNGGDGTKAMKSGIMSGFNGAWDTDHMTLSTTELDRRWDQNDKIDILEEGVELNGNQISTTNILDENHHVHGNFNTTLAESTLEDGITNNCVISTVEVDEPNDITQNYQRTGEETSGTVQNGHDGNGAAHTGILAVNTGEVSNDDTLGMQVLTRDNAILTEMHPGFTEEENKNYPSNSHKFDEGRINGHCIAHSGKPGEYTKEFDDSATPNDKMATLCHTEDVVDGTTCKVTTKKAEQILGVVNGKQTARSMLLGTNGCNGSMNTGVLASCPVNGVEESVQKNSVTQG